MAVIALSLHGYNFNTMGIFGQSLRAYNHISRFVMPLARYRRYMQNRDSVYHILLNEMRNYQVERNFNLIVQNQYVPPLRAFNGFNQDYLTPGPFNQLVNYRPNYNNQLMQDMANVQLQMQRNYFNNIRNHFPQDIVNYNEPVAQRNNYMINRGIRDDNNMNYGEVNLPGVDYSVYGHPLSTSAFVNVGRRLLYRALFGADAVVPRLEPNMPFEDREDFQ